MKWFQIANLHINDLTENLHSQSRRDFCENRFLIMLSIPEVPPSISRRPTLMENTIPIMKAGFSVKTGQNTHIKTQKSDKACNVNWN